MKRYISGTVIDGDKIGRTLGFPTANIAYTANDIANAVFKVNIVINGTIYSGMWVHAVWKKTFEVHIFDFSQDIYGQKIEIYLLQHIRENRRFASLQDLTKQLQKDKITIENIQTKVLTFGTFDVFHKGHVSYLQQAKRYGTFLSTIIARDTTVEKIKWFLPKHSEEVRKKYVEDSSIPQKVILWDLVDPLIPVRKIDPDIICLWYDQKSFPQYLNQYIQETGIDIIRLESHKPEIYKSSKLR